MSAPKAVLFLTAGSVLTLTGISVMDDIIVPNVTSKEPVRSLIESGVATKEDFKAAAQKGIDDLVAVASQHFPGTVNGLPVDPHAAARQAVEAYLAGDKSNPPVVKVPAVEKPAVPAPQQP